MKSLHQRARAEEAVYANRKATEFASWAGGLRRLGEWAATEMMGDKAPAVEAYADALVKAGVAGLDTIGHVGADLRDAGLSVDDATVRSRFDQCLAEARERNV